MIKFRSIILLLFVLFFVMPVMAQKMKLTALGGYTFQDKVYGYYGDITIKDGPTYGIALGYKQSQRTMIELSYYRQETTYDIIDYYETGDGSGQFPGSLNYIMIGSSHSPNWDAKVAPYGGIMLGVGIFSAEDISGDEVKFSFAPKLGAVIHANERIGIVLQAELMVPVQGVGLSVGCGSGGCGTGASTYSNTAQFGFTGGIEFSLGN